MEKLLQRLPSAMSGGDPVAATGELTTAVEEQDFVTELTRPNHLILADYLALKPGDELDVVVWDRNYQENGIWDRPQKTPYDPEVFFAGNRCKIVYKEEYKWEIHYTTYSNLVVHHSLEVSLEGMNTNWTWAPIEPEDGMLHITSKIVKHGETQPSHWGPIHKHLSDFSTSTRVGWRGPMMLWSQSSRCSGT